MPSSSPGTTWGVRGQAFGWSDLERICLAGVARACCGKNGMAGWVVQDTMCACCCLLGTLEGVLCWGTRQAVSVDLLWLWCYKHCKHVNLLWLWCYKHCNLQQCCVPPNAPVQALHVQYFKNTHAWH
eukprot:6180313-Alexandrium_andersonii.AAC.1